MVAVRDTVGRDVSRTEYVPKDFVLKVRRNDPSSYLSSDRYFTLVPPTRRRGVFTLSVRPTGCPTGPCPESQGVLGLRLGHLLPLGSSPLVPPTPSGGSLRLVSRPKTSYFSSNVSVSLLSRTFPSETLNPSRVGVTPRTSTRHDDGVREVFPFPSVHYLSRDHRRASPRITLNPFWSPS